MYKYILEFSLDLGYEEGEILIHGIPKCYKAKDKEDRLTIHRTEGNKLLNYVYLKWDTTHGGTGEILRKYFEQNRITKEEKAVFRDALRERVLQDDFKEELKKYLTNGYEESLKILDKLKTY